MTIIVCVCDYWHNCWYLELTREQFEVDGNLSPSSSVLAVLQKMPVHKKKKFHKAQSLKPKISSKVHQPNHNNYNNYINSSIDRQLQDGQGQRQELEYERSSGGKEEDTIILTKAGPLPMKTTTTIQAARDTILKESNTNPIKGRRLVQKIDAISAHYFLRELIEQIRFRSLLIEHLESKSVDQLRLQIVPPTKEIIDYKFNQMVAHDIWERIEVEYLMAWLSTLGGGFSALGEHFENCAATAGKISLKQLSIGLRLGDPFLQARCRLYFSISLIQRGQLRAAKHIIREQYKFANANRVQDSRLLKMCHGIWLRLLFEYAQKKNMRRSQSKCLAKEVQDK